MKKAYILIIILTFILCGCANSNAISSNNIDTQPTESDYLALDERSWKQFVKLYDAHNKFMNAIDKYASGNVSLVTFYSYCQDMESYFMEQSLNFDYGTTEEEITYLSPFKTWALADQAAAKKMMKYLDSGKASDLNAVRENINRATEAVSTIANNRGVLLVKAGLTDDEIHTKVEADMKELDNLTQMNSIETSKKPVNMYDEEIVYMADGTTNSTLQNTTPSTTTQADKNYATTRSSVQEKTSTNSDNTTATEEDLSIYNSANLQKTLNNPNEYVEEQITVGGTVVADYNEKGIKAVLVEPKGYLNKYVYFYNVDEELNNQNVFVGDEVIIVGVILGSENYQGITVPIASLDSCILYE